MLKFKASVVNNSALSRGQQETCNSTTCRLRSWQSSQCSPASLTLTNCTTGEAAVGIATRMSSDHTLRNSQDVAGHVSTRMMSNLELNIARCQIDTGGPYVAI